MNPFELLKKRELIFSDDPSCQVEQAYLLLTSIENLRVERSNQPNALIIHYSLEHYSHEALERALIKEGFRFKESWFDIIHKHLVHYCEDVQKHNLDIPEHHTKKNESEVFAKAYEKHPHGNHDDTPPELREYK